MTAEFWNGVWVLGLFGSGVIAGLLSRRGPLFGWAALALPLVLPSLSVGLMVVFC